MRLRRISTFDRSSEIESEKRMGEKISFSNSLNLWQVLSTLMLLMESKVYQCSQVKPSRIGDSDLTSALSGHSVDDVARADVGHCDGAIAVCCRVGDVELDRAGAHLGCNRQSC